MGTITNPDDLNKMRAARQDAAKVLDFITPTSSRASPPASWTGSAWNT